MGARERVMRARERAERGCYLVRPLAPPLLRAAWPSLLRALPTARTPAGQCAAAVSESRLSPAVARRPRGRWRCWESRSPTPPATAGRRTVGPSRTGPAPRAESGARRQPACRPCSCTACPARAGSGSWRCLRTLLLGPGWTAPALPRRGGRSCLPAPRRRGPPPARTGWSPAALARAAPVHWARCERVRG